MEGFYRIAAATPRLHLGDPAANVKELVRGAKDAVQDGVAAIVFPELCLTGYTCGDMFFRDELLDAASAAAETLRISVGTASTARPSSVLTAVSSSNLQPNLWETRTSTRADSGKSRRVVIRDSKPRRLCENIVVSSISPIS